MNISVNYDVWILQRDNNSVSNILNMLLATSTIDFFESKLHFMSVLFAYASNVTVRVARGFRTAGTAISYSGVLTFIPAYWLFRQRWEIYTVSHINILDNFICNSSMPRGILIILKGIFRKARHNIWAKRCYFRISSFAR